MSGNLAAILDRTVRHYPGVLSAEECSRIVDRSRGYGMEVVPQHGGGLLVAHPVDDRLDYRLGHGVAARLGALVRAFDAEVGWGIPFDIVRFGVSKYRVGDRMGLHVDDEERGPAWSWDLPHRGVSVSVPLTAGHVGGRLRLDGGGGEWVTPTASRGDAVLFGSSLPHEVLPVTAGMRWVLLAWTYCHHDRRDIR